MHFDFKASAVYVGAIFLGDINASLQAVGLIANIFYISYQYLLLKRKNKNEGEK